MKERCPPVCKCHGKPRIRKETKRLEKDELLDTEDIGQIISPLKAQNKAKFLS